ncbi:MAG: NFACT RNA binding domain-containing protein [Cyclobacteriaceae bacterium]
MHNNYFFLRSLVKELRQTLPGRQIQSCYTQDRDELVIILRDNTDICVLRAHLHPSFCCLQFPSDHKRAKKNTVDLFRTIQGRRIIDIRQHLHERAFSLSLDNEETLTFKMFGNRSNILLFNDNRPSEIFRSKLKQDLDIELDQLDRELDLSKEAFVKADGNPTRFLPVLGKILKDYLFENGYKTLSSDGQYAMITDLYENLQEPDFYIIEWQEKLHLSLVPLGIVREQFDDAVSALNAFFLMYIREGQLSAEKHRAINRISRELNRGLRYVDKNKQKLHTLKEETNYRKNADLIMANLHKLEAGQKKAVLDDLYNPGHTVEIRLKPELSPQKNAELLYRKAKNQHIETERLEENIAARKKALAELEERLDMIRKAENVRELRNLSDLPDESPGTDETLPYHEYRWQGFQVWLGKSGKSNDEMLRRCRKDDLWLHAKDVAGAHVIIRENPGTNYPAILKEKAAALAAHNSRRRTDSVCPVIATRRKYVRKRKGSPPGQVIVDREEEVLLVKPADWN